ncbi:MAG: hypothetical protein ACQKBY_00150 [Verrucomicrobiales bacterium]
MLKPDCIIHPDGTLSDAELYEEMLESEAGNLVADRAAVIDAVSRGIDLEAALDMFTTDINREAIKAHMRAIED